MMSRRLSVCISLQDEYRSDWHERIATFVGHALLWHHGLHCNYVLFPCIHLLTGGDARIDKEMKSPNQWTDFCGLCKTPPPQVLCQHGCIYRIFVCPLFSSTRFPRPLCHPLGGGHRLQVAYHDRILTFRLQVIHTILKITFFIKKIQFLTYVFNGWGESRVPPSHGQNFGFTLPLSKPRSRHLSPLSQNPGLVARGKF